MTWTWTRARAHQNNLGQDSCRIQPSILGCCAGGTAGNLLWFLPFGWWLRSMMMRIVLFVCCVEKGGQKRDSCDRRGCSNTGIHSLLVCLFQQRQHHRRRRRCQQRRARARVAPCCDCNPDGTIEDHQMAYYSLVWNTNPSITKRISIESIHPWTSGSISSQFSPLRDPVHREEYVDNEI